MTINTQKQVEAIEAGNYQQQEEVVDTSAQGTNEKTLTLAQVISMQYSNKDAERPVNIRNVEYKELLSKRDNPFIQMSWEYRYRDHDGSKWWPKKGVIYDGQGKLVHDFLVEYGISEEETYIVKSKKVKGADGKEYSQWVSFCHISAYDEAA